MVLVLPQTVACIQTMNGGFVEAIHWPFGISIMSLNQSRQWVPAVRSSDESLLYKQQIYLLLGSYDYFMHRQPPARWQYGNVVVYLHCSHFSHVCWSKNLPAIQYTIVFRTLELKQKIYLMAKISGVRMIWSASARDKINVEEPFLSSAVPEFFTAMKNSFDLILIVCSTIVCLLTQTKNLKNLHQNRLTKTKQK